MTAPARTAYLGPPGTFSEDALLASGFAAEGTERIPVATIRDVVLSVAEGRAERGLAPVENSIEGSVRVALDALAELSDRIRVIGEYDHPVRSSLIAREELQLPAIEEVISHPQPLAQCSRFLREELPGAKQRVADSTAEAVRLVSESERPWAALGTRTAAANYGCAILREGLEDEAGNVTRFAWIGPAGSEPAALPGAAGWKTMLVFAELGADHPGALVEALREFSDRQVNLSRIESRPLRRELGRYTFFIDVEGAEHDDPVAAAISGLREQAEFVHVLGSFPVAPPG